MHCYPCIQPCTAVGSNLVPACAIQKVLFLQWELGLSFNFLIHADLGPWDMGCAHGTQANPQGTDVAGSCSMLGALLESWVPFQGCSEAAVPGPCAVFAEFAPCPDWDSRCLCWTCRVHFSPSVEHGWLLQDWRLRGPYKACRPCREGGVGRPKPTSWCAQTWQLPHEQ